MILLLIACSSSLDSSASHMLGVRSDTGDTGDSAEGETAEVETGGRETGSEETGTADTGLDTADTGSVDTGADTADTADTSDTVDTSPPPCTGLVFTPASVTFEVVSGYAKYTTDSVTFEVTGCGTNVTAMSHCASSYGWYDLSLPGDTDPAVFEGECALGSREYPLLDDSGAAVDGEVTAPVTLTLGTFDEIDPGAWTAVTINSDQGSFTVRVDFD